MKKPFFAKFLEDQMSETEKDFITGGKGAKTAKGDSSTPTTKKYPSDTDEATSAQTKKYPSDTDEA